MQAVCWDKQNFRGENMKGKTKRDGSGKGTNQNKGRGCNKATGKNQR
jgi:hypothetical protein